MSQFDICRNPDSGSADDVPYLLVLQSDLFSDLRTCVVAPLYRVGEFQPVGRLNPVIEFEGDTLVLSTAELLSVPRPLLGAAVTSASARRDEIIAALDLLFTGI